MQTLERNYGKGKMGQEKQKIYIAAIWKYIIITHLSKVCYWSLWINSKRMLNVIYFAFIKMTNTFRDAYNL